MQETELQKVTVMQFRNGRQFYDRCRETLRGIHIKADDVNFLERWITLESTAPSSMEAWSSPGSSNAPTTDSSSSYLRKTSLAPIFYSRSTFLNDNSRRFYSYSG